jgi:diguanylate cyclase (GGDEF)-like protein
LTQSLPTDGKTFSGSVGLVKSAKGLAIVAAAPVLPQTEGKTIPEPLPRLLIFSKTLTPDFISILGKRLILGDLELTLDTTGPKAAFALAGSSGSPLGYLRWTADRPGDKAMAKIELPAIIATLAMIACMLTLSVVSSRLSLRLQRRERQSWELANTDTLTGLPNRHAAMRLIGEKSVVHNCAETNGLTVMLADLDGFKEVNDIYGHDIGDTLLRSVSAGMSVIAAKFDAELSRLGGDEFAFILHGAQAADRARKLASSVLGFLQQPIDIDGRITKVGMSIGIAECSGEEAADELLRRADVAMYVAKGLGKNQWLIYLPGMDAERNSRVRLAEQLKLALANREIQVEFQPIVDAASHRITGVEALARWTLPNGEKVSPDEFIGVTEEFGLIDELGNQVLAIACREAMAWPDLLLSVNISPAQFRNPNFLDNLIAIVDRSGMPRDRLELEITEGYMIQNRERTKPIIDYLIAEGFKITLDDFGSGFSSIGYLREFSFGKLKIDKSLAEDMLDNHSSRSIIAAAASIAGGMDMSVTGEGVETAEQAEMLRLLGCNTLQGYFFSRPVSAQAFTALLAGQDSGCAAA